MKEFLRKLIRAESTHTQGELGVAEIIASQFGKSNSSATGIESKIDIWDKNRANVFAHIALPQVKSANKGPALLFVCHLDVVPPGQTEWEYPPFSATENDGKIHGRGSADMKGGIAAVVTAIREIVDSQTELAGDIIFLATAGEETDSCGIKRFVRNCQDKLPKITGIIIPEPTNFDIVTAHRGILWLKVTTKGRATHGSTPESGINAITKMKSLLNELDNYKIPFEPHNSLGNCSMSVNTIEGGKSLNTVPDKCTITIDIRTLPTQNHQDIVKDFEKICAKLKRKDPQFDAEVSITKNVPSLETDSDCSFVKDFCIAVEITKTKAVGFCTDGPFLTSLDAPIVIFGPGKPELCHKPDEYIDIADIEKAVDYYKKIILKFLT